MKYIGRRSIMPITNGSMNERWLAAMISGPSFGTCCMPIRCMRKYTRKNGCRIARAIQ